MWRWLFYSWESAGMNILLTFAIKIVAALKKTCLIVYNSKINGGKWICKEDYLSVINSLQTDVFLEEQFYKNKGEKCKRLYQHKNIAFYCNFEC